MFVSVVVGDLGTLSHLHAVLIFNILMHNFMQDIVDLHEVVIVQELFEKPDRVREGAGCGGAKVGQSQVLRGSLAETI